MNPSLLPDIATLWWTACLVLVVYTLVSTARSYWRLRHFKGPPLAAFSHLWYIRAALSGRGHLYLSEVCTKYGMSQASLCWNIPGLIQMEGTTARIGPNTLVTCDEDL